MILNIDEVEVEVIPKDDSFRYRKIMSDDNLTLKFSLPTFIEFPLGTNCEFEGKTYTLNTPQIFNKVHKRNFEYTLVMSSDSELLKNYKIKDSTGRLKFPLTAKPQEHLQLIVNVLNTYDSGWTIDECIVFTEKLISYNHNNCLDALNSIAKEFETEWEIIGKAISLKKVEYNLESPLALSYGKGNGFKSGVGRQNESTGFNVLYVQGGDRNISFVDYGSKDLLLPKNEEYTYSGVTYQTDANGLFIVEKDVTITNRKEESLDLSNIYPQRVGEVSTVVEVDAENNFYDFTDSTIEFDFNDYIIEGETLTVIFNTGILTGKEFEVKYIHDDKRFEIVPQELDGTTMPNDTYKPSVSDEYGVFGMMLPEEYISDDEEQTGASWDMFKQACQYFFENRDSKFSFTGELDGIWANSDWENIGGKIKLGGYVDFSDTEFQPTGLDIRIVGIKDFVNKPKFPIIELSNSVQSNGIISEIKKSKDNEVTTEDYFNESVKFTKRRFRDAQETTKLLEAAFLNFDSSVRPLSVETMQLLVGDKSLQFRFVDSKVDPEVITQDFTYTDSKLSTSATIIEHLTLGIDNLTLNPTRLVWDIDAYESAVLSDPDKSYYLYAKVSDSAETGVFVLSETAIGIDDVSGYYHLLTGILNSEYEGDRSFVKMYGFTEILPGQIRVDELASTDGAHFIKLLGDEIQIKGNVEFSSDSPAIGQVSDSIKIGGRNLILISEILDAFVQFEKISEKKVSLDGGGVLRYAYVAIDTDFKENTTYGLRFKHDSDGDDNCDFQITYTDASYEYISSVNGEFVEYFTPNTKTVSVVTFYYYPAPYPSGTQPTYAFLEEWELVEGNKFIGWNPAPEDLGYLGLAFNNKTNISGGLLASSLIKLGAIEESEDNWVEKSGMSGLNDNIGFYTGGDYDDAVANLVKTLLRKDGSGYFADGNISFDTSGNLIVKAIIEALSGKIGAFDISANGISTDGIVLDTSDIEDLVDIGGADTETTILSSATDNVSNETIDTESVSEAYVESISITTTSRLRFGISSTQSELRTTSSLVQVKNDSDEVVFADLISINNAKEYDITLPTGTYDIYFTTRGFTTDVFNTNNNSITAISGETKILVEPVSAATKIAANGMYSYWGSDKYLYFEKDYGFQVRFGSYVFKISSASGLQKSSDGGGIWSSL